MFKAPLAFFQNKGITKKYLRSCSQLQNIFTNIITFGHLNNNPVCILYHYCPHFVAENSEYDVLK